jgi:hypothetical protein
MGPIMMENGWMGEDGAKDNRSGQMGNILFLYFRSFYVGEVIIYHK